MKIRVLQMAALAVLTSCAMNGYGSDEMTAGEEVLWMHDWMERAYGPEPEDGYDWNLYVEQEDSVREYLDSNVLGFRNPDAPADLVEYFAGVPADMLGEYAGKFSEVLQKMQRYADDRSDFLPMDEYREVMSFLMDRYSDMLSHSGLEMSPLMASYVTLFFRLAQQLVRICPDMDLLCDCRENEFGVIMFDGMNYLPSLSVIVVSDTAGVAPMVVLDAFVVSISEDDELPDLYHFFAQDSWGDRYRELSVIKDKGKWCVQDEDPCI